MLGAAIGTTATTLVGQNMGVERYERANASGWEAVKLGMMAMGALGILFILVPAPIMRIYTDDLKVIQMGVIILRILGIAQIFSAIGIVLSPALIGAGDIRFILGVEIGNTCLLYLPLACFLGVHSGFGIPSWDAKQYGSPNPVFPTAVDGDLSFGHACLIPLGMRSCHNKCQPQNQRNTQYLFVSHPKPPNGALGCRRPFLL
ncbi:hypothetical protein KAW44_03930, partial [Candidatus Bipolaricaulota bacterium]|nr:hypothetical protein [Candidatus Bipolaricaulota bacterium]